MTPSTKPIVGQDVEQARRDASRATISVKNSSTRSDALLKADKQLLARSRGRVANVRNRFKPENAPDPPRRGMLERHLEQAERHIAASQQHLSRQRERIAQFERNHHDASTAKALLELFEDLDKMHIAHRDRIADELGKATKAA